MSWSVNTKSAHAFRGLLLALTLIAGSAFAQQGPKSINVSGGLFDSVGKPLTGNVNFRLEIWDKAASCLIYSEEHPAQDLSATKGGFSLEVGLG